MTAGPSRGAAFDVGAWLSALGLEQYEAAFRENAIDGAVLPTWPPTTCGKWESLRSAIAAGS
jgi:hypothetical protein